jgi:hypothetical protein
LSEFKCRSFPTDIILGRQGALMIAHLPFVEQLDERLPSSLPLATALLADLRNWSEN